MNVHWGEIMFRRPYRGLCVSVAAALAGATFLTSPAVVTAEESAAPSATTRQLLEETGGVEGGVADARVNQTPEQALRQDLGLVARSRGWTYAQAEAQYRAAAEVGALAEVIARERPDIFVGSALSEKPGGAPRLYVKGPADDFVRELVRSSGADVIVADNQPYSFEELEARKLTVHHALEDMGFSHVATSVNITGGVIPAGVTARPGLPAQAADIVAALPAGVRGAVRLTVRETPNVSDEAAFGGMWVRDDGANECTSGWSVRSIATDTPGVTTAGHCDGINEINHPGHGVHTLVHQNEHRGQWGDVEWKTSTEPEPDDFYASATDIRDTTAIEARANISVNEAVCAYGRSSNDRDCSLSVQDVSQSCTNSGVFNDRLVLMDGDTQIGGDSGGGWSFGTIAYGGHKGNCSPSFPDLEVWSVADLFDEAIGVRVVCGVC